MPWVYDPQGGGVKIPLKTHNDVCNQIETFARTRPWYPKNQLKVRFRNQFCYIDTIKEGDDRFFPLCRLRYFTQKSWSFALFTYSNERYEPCIFSNGKWEGTIEAVLEICEPFII